jgi:hypothetical protein
MNEAAYNTHIKSKHSEEKSGEDAGVQEESRVDKGGDKKPAKKAPSKNRILENQQNELEDTIYAFLG